MTLKRLLLLMTVVTSLLGAPADSGFEEFQGGLLLFRDSCNVYVLRDGVSAVLETPVVPTRAVAVHGRTNEDITCLASVGGRKAAFAGNLVRSPKQDWRRRL